MLELYVPATPVPTATPKVSTVAELDTFYVLDGDNLDSFRSTGVLPQQSLALPTADGGFTDVDGTADGRIGLVNANAREAGRVVQPD